MVYKSLVHPVLEYSSPVWGPLLSQALDTVQRRAAYWVLSNYNWSSSASSMLNYLGWPTLAKHHLLVRLSIYCKIVHHCLLHKCLHNSLPHHQPSHIPVPSTSLLNYNSSSRTNFYINSFYPRTIRD